MKTYEDGVNRPLCYTLLLQWFSNAANKCGYALGLHGSMVRDLDLIAVPWTEDAVDRDSLITELVKTCGGWLTQMETEVNPAFKPHGRIAYTIQLGRGLYVDVSVMPRTGAAQVSFFEKTPAEP
jgi:hypothetical protein